MPRTGHPVRTGRLLRPVCRLARLVLLGGFSAAWGIVAAASPTLSAAAAPLAGIVRAAGRPIPGVTIVLRRLGGGDSGHLLSAVSGPDGGFVVAGTPAGVYTLVALVPGFLPSVKRVLHEVSAANTSALVAVDLEAPSRERTLAQLPSGGLDPWAVRAVLPGDPLRDVDVPPSPVLTRDGSRERLPTSQPGESSRASLTRPVHARVESLTGFGATGTAARSRALLDVEGRLSEAVRFDLEGAYDRLSPLPGVAAGDGQRIALEIAGNPSAGPSARSPSVDAAPALRLSTRRQNLPYDTGESFRYAAHAVDATLPTGASSAASVSARYVSQSNLAVSPVPSLFARDATAVEILARYTSGSQDGRFVRLSVSWRSDTQGLESATQPVLREARVGGSLGVRVLDVVSLEGTVTGDLSSRARGVVPELLVALEPTAGVRVYAAASRRYERDLDPWRLAWGVTGSDEELVRLSRGLVRAGVRLQESGGDSLALEGSRREFAGAFRLLLDPDFFDHVDAVYFFPGDVASEGTLTATFRLGEGLQGSLSLRGGRISGSGSDGTGFYPVNDVTFGRAEAAVRVASTGTSVACGYRVVRQSLSQGERLLSRNDLSAVDVTLGQTLPLSFLAAIGSEWRLLFSLESGSRRDDTGELVANRRLAGGVSLSF